MKIKFFFYEPKKGAIPPNNKISHDLGKAKFFPIGTAGRMQEPIDNLMDVSIQRWLKEGQAKCEDRIFFICNDNQIIESFHMSKWSDFLKRHLSWENITITEEETPALLPEIQTVLEQRVENDHDPILNSMGKQPHLTSTLKFEDNFMQDYLNQLASQDNGVDGVFVLNASTGRILCISNVAGAGGSVDLNHILNWTGANAAQDSVGTLDEMIGGNGLKYVDYTFTNAILRLFYISSNQKSVVIGFVGTNPKLMGKFDFETPGYTLELKQKLGM